MPRGDVYKSLACALLAILLVLDWMQYASDELEQTIEEAHSWQEWREPPTNTTTLSPYQPHTQPTEFRNLRLVFLGDSVTRYQYLSLAYYLRHGRWLDPALSVNNLVNAHSFHHPLHPDDDWNEFFLQSNRLLHPMEICDCLRDRKVVLERRYFYDAERENLLVYINMNGNVSTTPGKGYYGRLLGAEIFGPRFAQQVGLPFGLGHHHKNHEDEIVWEYSTWGDVIRYHIGSMDLMYSSSSSGTSLATSAPTFFPPASILLNAGLHPHSFWNPQEADDMHAALQSVGLYPTTWKTTTYKLQQVLEYQSAQKFSHSSHATPHVRGTDQQMCTLLGSCFNLSWTANLRPELYFDDLHFLEPIYRILNEEYLDQLGVLPPGYEKLSRQEVLVDELYD